MKAASLVSLLILGLTGPALAKGGGDEAAIRALQQQQADAWNKHEITAYANLFTTDAHVINVLGWNWQSRAELQQKLGAAFKSVFARSQLRIGEVAMEFVGPGIAVAHVRWTMAGALSPTGSGTDVPEQGIQMQVLVKQHGAWKIRDFQNTNSVPETAFPPAR